MGSSYLDSNELLARPRTYFLGPKLLENVQRHQRGRAVA